MAGDDDFNERVRRIQQSRGITPGASPQLGSLPTRQRKTASRFPRTILHVAVIAVVLGGGAYAFRQTQADAAALQAVGLSEGEGDQRSFLSRMIADALLPFPSETPAKDDPVMLLPPAPVGWVRVTSIDAQGGDPMADIAARWAALDSPHGLDQSLGYPTLVRFLQANGAPDTESRVLAKRRSTAVYLGRDGGFVVVDLKFRNSRMSLGKADDRDGWQVVLAAEEKDALLSGEVLETLDLGGFAALNRAPARGKSLIARPIGRDMDTPNSLRLAVPVAPRAVVRIEGAATPQLAADLLAALDREAVAASSEK